MCRCVKKEYRSKKKIHQSVSEMPQIQEQLDIHSALYHQSAATIVLKIIIREDTIAYKNLFRLDRLRCGRWNKCKRKMNKKR